ncbi:Asp-tRNA(Asn)/Glu-tRNA(Gln) amidotransferase GatCAB subunit A [Lentibacillus sp. CBA3610]|nr:Asp-tRNA(Asn)/Glu-tRNA(Gln) amidotransferase GatCAB subunit A [Lentibacillus sp. CBA3610]
MTDLAFLTASELAPLIESRQVSPVELTTHTLNRIDQIDPAINAYITPVNELAFKEASKAENEIMHGYYKGPLHGIPIGIKDNFETKGIRTTAGSKILADYIPDKTSTAVKKLLDAGGITLGKQNTHEFAAGTTNINPFYGPSRNPWNTEHMTGGSSGGSAAALAAGLGTLAVGSDTIGSIRIPSAMNGTYGLKPTHGLISGFGSIPTAWSMDHPGPMARSVTDLALMLHYMAGYDPNDPASLHVPAHNYTGNLNKGIVGIRIGIPTYYLEGLDSDVEVLFKQAITTLQSLGADIREIDIPELSMSTFSGLATMSGEASAFHYEWLKTRSEDYGADIRAFLQTGVLSSATQYLKAQQARRKLVKGFDKAFADVDIIAGPTIPITAPAFQENWVEQNLAVESRCVPFTAPSNLTGMPNLSAPMGLNSKGLPAGMQFIGNHLCEKQLLQVGHAWERCNPLGFRINS